MSIRILLADDHRIIQEGLRNLLEGQNDVEVVAAVATGREALEQARRLSPDVIIMDVTMPDLNGVDATRRILAHRPGVKIIALSMHSDRRYVTEMFKAGASGYLLKDCAFEELSRAIRTVVANQTYLSPRVADVVIEGYLRHVREDESSAYAVLTPREREVLQLLAEGKTTKQIAFHLHVSVKTVDTHKQQMMNKLNIHSVAELTKYAVREGLTSLDP